MARWLAAGSRLRAVGSRSVAALLIRPGESAGCSGHLSGKGPSLAASGLRDSSVSRSNCGCPGLRSGIPGTTIQGDCCSRRCARSRGGIGSEQASRQGERGERVKIQNSAARHRHVHLTPGGGGQRVGRDENPCRAKNWYRAVQSGTRAKQERRESQERAANSQEAGKPRGGQSNSANFGPGEGAPTTPQSSPAGDGRLETWNGRIHISPPSIGNQRASVLFFLQTGGRVSYPLNCAIGQLACIRSAGMQSIINPGRYRSSERKQAQGAGRMRTNSTGGNAFTCSLAAKKSARSRGFPQRPAPDFVCRVTCGQSFPAVEMHLRRRQTHAMEASPLLPLPQTPPDLPTWASRRPASRGRARGNKLLGVGIARAAAIVRVGHHAGPP